MTKLTPLTKSVLQLVLLALGCYFLFLIQTVLVYIAISLVLTLILKPVTNLLVRIKIKRWHVPAPLAAALTIATFMGLAILMGMFIIPLVLRDMNFFSQIDYFKLFDVLENNLKEVADYLMKMGLVVDFEFIHLKENLLEIININLMGEAAEILISGLGNVAVMLFSVGFILFFLLKQQRLGENLAVLMTQDAGQLEKARKILAPIKSTLTRYFLGLLLQIAIISVVVYTGLSLIGIENAVLIAIFAGFINLIPYIGPVIGFSFGLTLGLGQAFAMGTTDGLLLTGIQISLVFMVMQLTDNLVLQPLIYSKSIRAHPLEIFLVISIAALIGGISAMVIAIPFYSVLRIFIWEFFPDFPLIKHLKKDA